MIKGISFDFWDTLFVDDSDEKKRAGLGLRPKAEERFHLLDSYLSFKGGSSSFLIRGINDEKKWFENEWKTFHRTPVVEERVEKICETLKVSLSRESLLELVSKLENMEVEVQPDPFDGCLNILKELSKQYKLAITSDAIYTSGEGIRTILKDNGMLDLFECFSFSNEVGVSKPHKDIFLNTLRGLNLKSEEVIHVGDRIYNDILGGQRSGLKTVWLNQKGNEERQEVRADIEIKSLGELPQVIKKFDLN